jgi:uncharacterized protein YodC (DUF2158 family)
LEKYGAAQLSSNTTVNQTAVSVGWYRIEMRSTGSTPAMEDVMPVDQEVVEYEIGDIVRLKSGGPDMTVIKIYRDVLDLVVIRCAWFSEELYYQQEFPEGALEFAQVDATTAQTTRHLELKDA